MDSPRCITDERGQPVGSASEIAVLEPTKTSPPLESSKLQTPENIEKTGAQQLPNTTANQPVRVKVSYMYNIYWT